MKENPLIYNIVPVVDDCCETRETDLEEEKNNVHACDVGGEEENTLYVCKNQLFQCNINTVKSDKNFMAQFHQRVLKMY